MGTRTMEDIGPRLELTTCVSGRRGIPNGDEPEAVAALRVRPDGTAWVTVMRDGDPFVPTGEVEISLSVAEAELLARRLLEAVQERKDAVAHGCADK